MIATGLGNGAADKEMELRVLADLAERQRRMAKIFDVLRLGFECSKDCKFCSGDGIAGYSFVPPQKLPGGKWVPGYYNLEKCRNARMRESWDPLMMWKRVDALQIEVMQMHEEMKGMWQVGFKYMFWGLPVFVMKNVWTMVKRVWGLVTSPAVKSTAPPSPTHGPAPEGGDEELHMTGKIPMTERP